MSLSEVRLARVPQQMLTPDLEEEQENDHQIIDEFSGVGSIVGYSVPLGTPSLTGKQKKSKKR